MKSSQPTVLLFGDYTEPWIESVDVLCKQADSTPWLHAFLDDIAQLMKDYRKELEPFLQASLGEFTDLQTLADRWRHKEDEIAFVSGLMLYTIRAAFFLQYVFLQSCRFVVCPVTGSHFPMLSTISRATLSIFRVPTISESTPVWSGHFERPQPILQAALSLEKPSY